MTTPKFDRSAVTEALYDISLDGWFTADSGDVEAPTGWFAWTEIQDDEAQECFDLLPEDLREQLVAADLVGGWLLQEDSSGLVSATRFDLQPWHGLGVPDASHSPARAAFDGLAAAYGEWFGRDES